MAKSKMMSGCPVLMGDNTIPGVRIPKEVQDQIPIIMKAVKDFGCDYYPTVVEFLTYDEISEVAAYGGFPVRYPHWRFGMEYEELSKGYEYGMHRIYEMVINTNPCYIYCLDSNTLVDNVTVVAHALFHNDFFKNNIHFEPTNTNMLNKFANHATRIREYMARWGKERVTEFIDYVLRIETLIDPVKGWSKKKYKDPLIKDKRSYKFPSRRDVGDHTYMEEWLNPRREQDRKWNKIHEQEAAFEIGAFGRPDKDIFGFLKDHAPLKPWQQDVISMLYDESMYFQPQRMTKVLNEGWASMGDSKMMAHFGLISLGQPSHDAGIFEYAQHKMGVLGGKYSTNPYKLGYCLFQDIEERWDKGQFGSEWEDCEDQREKERWNKKLGLGREKIFEVRRCYNDLTAINEFFTQEFCDKYEYYDWKRFPNGEYKIVSRDAKEIKKKLMRRHLNGGLPDIRITDDNHLGKGWLCLEHKWDGRTLYDKYVRDTLVALNFLWQQPVVLSTKDKNNDEFVYVCEGTDSKQVYLASRSDYDKHIVNKKPQESEA
jgi:stage V sporulation protein R